MHTGPEAGDRALSELLRRSRLAPSEALPGIVADAAAHLGATDVVVHVVDHAQTVLVPFGTPGEHLGIDGTVAGRAFRQVEVTEVQHDDGTVRVHIPLLDSVDRIGMLSLTAPTDADRERLITFADLTAELLVAKAGSGDAIVRAARLQHMSLAGEVQWALLPPLTVATDRVVIAAMLEPCYDVGGDVVDYAVEAGCARLAIFDAMGHDLPAAILASVAVGAYRNARRAGADLAETADRIDAAVGAQFGEDRLVTAVLMDLDLGTGRLRWVNAGHPPPLLLREGRVVKELAGPAAEPPLGMGLRTSTTVHNETLQPGDRLLGYTDGVIEARSPEGALFGLPRLVEMVTTAEASGVQAPETMRQVSRAILAHQQDHLQDDATHVLLEWSTREPPLVVV